MFKSINKLAQKKRKKKSFLSHNQNGDLLFEMQLKKEQVYSPFSVENNKILNPELLEQFDVVFEEISAKENIEFLIHTEDASKENRDNFEKTLDHHYLKKLEVSNRNFKSHILQGVLLFFIGIVLYAGFHLCRNFIDPRSVASWFEILNIASWVFVWEAVDVVFLGSINHSIEKHKYRKMIDAKITFVKIENKKIKKQNKE